MFLDSLEIRVLPSVKLAGEHGAGFFKVVAEESSIQGVIFDFDSDESPVDVMVREVPIDDLPKPFSANILTSGFYTSSEAAVDLLVPLNIAPKPTKLPHVSYLAWNIRTNSWFHASRLIDLVVIDKKLYARLQVSNTYRLGVIVAEPG